VDDIAEFSRSGTISVRRYSEARDVEQIIYRAMSRVGAGEYHLVFNNCEHFASWCVTGIPVSEQVELATSTTGVVGTAAVAAT
jgi:hypothetical protein